MSSSRERLRLVYLLGRALPLLLRRFGLRALASSIWNETRIGGWKHCALRMMERAAYELREDPKLYRCWLQTHRPPEPIDTNEPVAIVMAFDKEDPLLGDAWRSVEKQTHRNWHLIAVGSAAPGSTDEARMTVLSGGGSIERRLAIAMATVKKGSHVLFMHPSCCLSDEAISVMLDALRTCDIVYCDEDEMVDGERQFPLFKPGFSIDLELASAFVGPVVLCRSEWLQKHPPNDERVSPREIVLMGHKRRARIVRVPEVLVHWLGPRPRPAVENVRVGGGHRGLASIIIPTRDGIDLLSKCVESIYRFRQQNAFEVLVLNNRSINPESLEWFAAAPTKFPGLRVIDADYAFNWSRLNNQGIAAARGDVLVFLNNDTEALSEHWLDHLVLQSLRPDVGTVGGLLLYPDLSIQHAGVVIGIGGVADHVYSGCPDRGQDRHLFVSPYLPRNVLAVTGACVAMSRRTVEEIGLFDERFQICGDVEMGVRAHSFGKLNVYDPQIRLLHHESATRPWAPLSETELEFLRPVIEPFVRRGDPFYHPHLSLRSRYPTFAAV